VIQNTPAAVNLSGFPLLQQIMLKLQFLLMMLMEFVAFLSAACNSLSSADAACASCPALTKLRTQISNGWPPSPKVLDLEMLPYYKLQLELFSKDIFIVRCSWLIALAALRSVLASQRTSGRG